MAAPSTTSATAGATDGKGAPVVIPLDLPDGVWTLNQAPDAAALASGASGSQAPRRGARR